MQAIMVQKRKQQQVKPTLHPLQEPTRGQVYSVHRRLHASIMRLREQTIMAPVYKLSNPSQHPLPCIRAMAEDSHRTGGCGIQTRKQHPGLPSPSSSCAMAKPAWAACALPYARLMVRSTTGLRASSTHTTPSATTATAPITVSSGPGGLLPDRPDACAPAASTCSSCSSSCSTPSLAASRRPMCCMRSRSQPPRPASALFALLITASIARMILSTGFSPSSPSSPPCAPASCAAAATAAAAAGGSRPGEWMPTAARYASRLARSSRRRMRSRTSASSSMHATTSRWNPGRCMSLDVTCSSADSCAWLALAGAGAGAPRMLACSMTRSAVTPSLVSAVPVSDARRAPSPPTSSITTLGPAAPAGGATRVPAMAYTSATAASISSTL
mmetsp:Transcript_13536/g.33211  ORF Transcript_13536/g.33211 Transcript_13536/m.33211 type:complete len:386 (-) Transcript_13536:308-1465(-)